MESLSDFARRLGVPPGRLSDFLWRSEARLPGGELPRFAGRRIVPTDRAAELEYALRRAGLIRREVPHVAH